MRSQSDALYKPNFNSTLVRLEVLHPANLVGFFQEFQFHSGTIRSQIGTPMQKPL